MLSMKISESQKSRKELLAVPGDKHPPNDSQWRMFTRGHWDKYCGELMYEIDKRSLDVEINCKFISQL